MAKTRFISRSPIIGNWYLVKATKDGNYMKKGQYGLVQCNDPDFIFDGPIEFDPTYNMTDSEINNMSKKDERQWDKFNRWYEQVAPSFDNRPEIGYLFVKSCMGKGYRPKKDGNNVLIWFLSHLSIFIKESRKRKSLSPSRRKKTKRGWIEKSKTIEGLQKEQDRIIFKK